MRVFIGIGFDENTKRYLKDIQRMVKNEAKSGNFTHYHNFHLTLRYIGEVNEKTLNQLKKILDITARQTSPFFFKIGDISMFRKGNGFIVWSKIISEVNALNNLYKKLESILQTIGIDKEIRPYTPHITLGKKIRFVENVFSRNINP